MHRHCAGCADRHRIKRDVGAPKPGAKANETPTHCSLVMLTVSAATMPAVGLFCHHTLILPALTPAYSSNLVYAPLLVCGVVVPSVATMPSTRSALAVVVSVGMLAAVLLPVAVMPCTSIVPSPVVAKHIHDWRSDVATPTVKS